MPVLPPPNEDVVMDLPPQKGRLAAQTSVLVVGGGPSGVGAALGAAEAGVDVVLVERYGFLGGNATAALVMPLMAFHKQCRHPVQEETGHKPYRLWPQDHGPGESVISGALEKFLRELEKNQGAIMPSEETGYVVPFDPEVFKWTALRMVHEAGVHFLFHAFASGVMKNKDELTGVIFQTKSGPLVIKADVIIDCTGDGDIAYQAGALYDVGRPADGLVQPMTLMFRMGEFESEAFLRYVKEHPGQWRGVHGLEELIVKATQAGELNLPRENLLFFATPHDKEVSVNSTRVTGVSGVNVWDLTRAEYVSRQQMCQIVSFLKRYVPGFEKAYAIQSGTQIGVRETRRIKGRYCLTGHDIMAATKHPDVIARNSYPIDIHNPEGKGTTLKNVPVGEAYDIPLRCLMPLDVRRLLVAGRCISGTHVAHSSYRVMPACMATGQAAGVCAALSVKNGRLPEDVDVRLVQKELLRQGADLG